MTLVLPSVIPELNSGQALSEARVEGSRGTRRELLYNTR